MGMVMWLKCQMFGLLQGALERNNIPKVDRRNVTKTPWNLPWRILILSRFCCSKLLNMAGLIRKRRVCLWKMENTCSWATRSSTKLVLQIQQYCQFSYQLLSYPARPVADSSEQRMGLITIRKHAYSNLLKILPPKTEIFQVKIDIFHISPQNMECGYALEPPRRGGSNEFPQSMLWAEIRKIMYTPVNPSFTI